MTTYLPRWAWTSAGRGGATLTADTLEGLAVHYPGRPAAYGQLSQRQEAAILRGIRRYHVGTNGWADIGYQVCVTQAGRVWDCRGISRVPAAHASAANPRANWRWGAVLLLVGNHEQLSDDLVEAFDDLRHRVWLERWPGTTDVRGHRQVPGASTTCPGDTVIQAISDGTLLGGTGGGGGGGGLSSPPSGTDWTKEAIMSLPTISRGNGGKAVRKAQALCLAFGGDARRHIQRTGGVDGRFGPGTEQAVEAVQAAGAPPVDGIVGPITWTKLIED